MLNLESHTSILPLICMPYKDMVKNSMLVVRSSDSPVLSLNDSFNKFVQRHWFFSGKTKVTCWIQNCVLSTTRTTFTTSFYSRNSTSSNASMWFRIQQLLFWINNWGIGSLIFAGTVSLRTTHSRRGSERGQDWTWQERDSGIDGWKKWIEKKKRGEERSVTPEHIKYLMRCVVQQRQERVWSERLAQLIYSTRREGETDTQRALRVGCVF